jgi:hypothetical protein
VEKISLLILIAVIFTAGFGWGQWYAERSIRQERLRLTSGRFEISMPMNQDDAAAMLTLLKDLIDEVKHRKDEPH